LLSCFSREGVSCDQERFGVNKGKVNKNTFWTRVGKTGCIISFLGNPMETDRTPEFLSRNKMNVLIEQFGRHLEELIEHIRPSFVVPLETKGAILLEMCLSRIRHSVPADLKIIYPRAFEYLKQEELRLGRFLIVDDTVFSCTTLKGVNESLTNKGVSKSQIYMTALLDFTRGEPDKEYHEDIYRRILFPPLATADVTKDEALEFIHDMILKKRMPSTYDHLLFVGMDVNQWQYEAILSSAADTNRLLDYGRRGAFLTSSILLEDLYPGAWDFPPKLRLWYHSGDKILRVAPVASPQYDVPPSFLKMLPASLFEEIKKTFISNLGTGSDRSKALYDARVYAARLQMVPYIYLYLAQAGLPATLEVTHLDRYFPGFGEVLANMAESFRLKQIETQIPERHLGDDSNIEPFGFLNAAKTILIILKGVYEAQSQEGVMRKDFLSRGFTGKELFEKLSGYTHEQVHAAIDYCFDMNYAAAFIRKNGQIARAMRATETDPKRLDAEVYAAAVISTQRIPTPAWMINKVFPIVANTGGGKFDGIIVIQKGPFGDFSQVVMSEASTLFWKEIPSDLWETTGGDDEYSLMFKARGDKESEFAKISRDPRIAKYRTPLEAALFLMREFGRNGAILLNITTGEYGGTDYITYNLEMILKHSISKEETKLLQDKQGVTEKLKLIRRLYEDKENLLTKLSRRCSRLGMLAPLAAAEAENIVKCAKIFPEKRLYDVLEELARLIMAMADSCQRGDRDGLSKNLLKLGITRAEAYGENASQTLYRAMGHLSNWLYVISARSCSASHYKEHVFHGMERASSLYILAYDLTAARHTHAESEGVEVARVTYALNTLVENWIIALGGRLSKTELNSGDLRYGFFTSFEDCLSAATWMLYHASQLPFVHRLFPRKTPFGIALTKGVIHEDTRGNPSAPLLDWTGHCLKGKLKEELDEVAGDAGRKGKTYEGSPIQVICYDEFPSSHLQGLPVKGRKHKLTTDGQSLEVVAFDVHEYLKTHPTPWAHRQDR
jgi:hypothetical protein